MKCFKLNLSAYILTEMIFYEVLIFFLNARKYFEKMHFLLDHQLIQSGKILETGRKILRLI